MDVKMPRSSTKIFDKYIGSMWRCIKAIQSLVTFLPEFPNNPISGGSTRTPSSACHQKSKFLKKKSHSHFEHNKMPNPKQDCKYLLLCKMIVNEYMIQKYCIVFV